MAGQAFWLTVPVLGEGLDSSGWEPLERVSSDLRFRPRVVQLRSLALRAGSVFHLHLGHVGAGDWCDQDVGAGYRVDQEGAAHGSLWCARAGAESSGYRRDLTY